MRVVYFDEYQPGYAVSRAGLLDDVRRYRAALEGHKDTVGVPAPLPLRPLLGELVHYADKDIDFVERPATGRDPTLAARIADVEQTLLNLNRAGLIADHHLVGNLRTNQKYPWETDDYI